MIAGVERQVIAYHWQHPAPKAATGRAAHPSDMSGL